MADVERKQNMWDRIRQKWKRLVATDTPDGSQRLHVSGLLVIYQTCPQGRSILHNDQRLEQRESIGKSVHLFLNATKTVYKSINNFIFKHSAKLQKSAISIVGVKWIQ